MNAKSETLMRRLNSIQVTPQDLEMVIQATRRVREDQRDLATMVGVITDKLPNANVNYRTAVAFRVLALARVAKDDVAKTLVIIRRPGADKELGRGRDAGKHSNILVAYCRRM